MNRFDVPKRNRRAFLLGSSAALLASPALASMRLRPVAEDGRSTRAAFTDAQSGVFQDMLDEASDRNRPVDLPPGDYWVSNIVLPKRTTIRGTPGATRILYSGGGYLFRGENAERIQLEGLTIDGRNGPLSSDRQGLVELLHCEDIDLRDCSVRGSSKSAVWLEGASGRVRDCHLAGAMTFGLYSVEAQGLRIEANHVAECGDGGILVHRWSKGTDGTAVRGNRVERIASRSGGTGQTGNGINVYQADNVSISDNDVADCAFSAIRANGASNLLVSANRCTGSGETAIYAEFGFEGAVISDNIVDGAANGISVVNANEGGRLAAVTGNLLRNIDAEGPYENAMPGFGDAITVEAETTVSGNTIEKAARSGIAIGFGEYGRNVVATGNFIHDCPTGIRVSVVEGIGPILLASNLTVDTPAGSIVGYRWMEAATPDLADDPQSAPPNLTITGHVAR